MNQKILIKEVLKYWYFTDSVLLNGHAKKVITDNKDYTEYISTKSALLSNLYELYSHVQFDPKDIEVPGNDKLLQESAVKLAKKSKAVSANMIQDKKFVEHMKQVVIIESKKQKVKNIKMLSEDIINTRFLKMSLDNILVGVPLIEARKPVKDFKSEILEETYLMLRSNLIEISKKYNPDMFSKKNVTEWVGGVAVAGLATLFGFKLIGSVARGIESFAQRCENRCGTLRIDATAKRICILKCRIQTHQKIVAGLRQSAAQTNNEKARDKFSRDVRRAQMKVADFQRQIVKLQSEHPAHTQLQPGDQPRIF